jgi:hypothetical protein
VRDFDPRLVGSLECRTWVTYYRREWLPFLVAAIRLVRHTFGLNWPATLYGAWLVLRANQLWAPYPDNDPEACRRCMRTFYGLLRRRHGEPRDIDEAARLEVEWWRVHRVHQRAERGGSNDSLSEALAALYAHTYRVPAESVRLAARERADAMDVSDRWVKQGCELDSPLIAEERAALVRSYAGLLAAVHCPV